MGRSKAKQSHKTKRASKKNETKENKHAESSVQELLSMVESAMDELQFDQARQLGERALRLEPDNLKTLDVLSGLLLEMGDVAGASQLLQRMIELEPNDGFRKYLSMGQLCDGKESLRHYSKGVEILQRLLGEKQGASAEAVRHLQGNLRGDLKKELAHSAVSGACRNGLGIRPRGIVLQRWKHSAACLLFCVSAKWLADSALLLSGDVASNPGPRHTTCTRCTKRILDCQAVLCCNACDV
ncbi:unnamed protein product [Ixodes pacificus]